ncbi:MAG TPA: hypothetical protein VEH82_08795, partial [Acidimicrobiales bacterium]|nr:hypothetical protein [Acidimicrobiales bacterium]
PPPPPGWPQPPPPGWPPPPPPGWPPPAGGFGAMPAPSPWERVAAPGGAVELPPWSRLVLSGAARGWMIFAIVWGSLLYVGQTVIRDVTTHRTQDTVQQYDTVSADSGDTLNALQKAFGGNGQGGQLQSCSTLFCLRLVADGVALSFARFDSDLRSMDIPSGAADSSARVRSDVEQLHTLFARLAVASSLDEYRSELGQSDVTTLLDDYGNDVDTLLNDLNSN